MSQYFPVSTRLNLDPYAMTQFRSSYSDGFKPLRHRGSKFSRVRNFEEGKTSLILIDLTLFRRYGKKTKK
jgi:hypothetical protein